MIDHIHGRIARKSGGGVVVEVGGIALEANISAATSGLIGEIGAEITLPTRLIHRADSMELFGFATELEREIFDNLICATGIGPKMAIKILSGLSAVELVAAIRSRDYRLLETIPGLGKKRAEKLCVELEGAMKSIKTEGIPAEIIAGGDAVEAMVSLGFPRIEAARAVRAAMESIGEAEPEDLIREALTEIKNKR